MRWVILLMLLPGAYALEWSEVHFNPIGNDNGREFVELLGTESLEGCSITDSASSDKLVLQQAGNDIIMIIENDNLIPLPEGITIYTIGAAIGNGLGNTGDSLTLACNSTLLAMAYNTSVLDGFAEGHSLHYKSGWTIGNATPGFVERPVIANGTVANSNETETSCDNSLAIGLDSEGYAGDTMAIRIISPGYAWFELTADDLPFASGDTLTTRVHTFVLPDARELKVTAYARECDAKQRAVRYVSIKKQEIQNVSVAVSSEPESVPESVPPAPVEQVPVTAQVILDQDSDAVPWIAGFGIVTVVASATVFLQLLRRGEA